MRRKLTSFFVFLFFIGTLFSQSSQCHGNYLNSFEDQNQGIWKNGDNGISLVATDKAQDGNYALKFTNAVNWPILTSVPIDMTIYEFLRFDCFVYAENMESGDGILLEVSRDNGLSFEIAKRWAYGVDFQNDQYALLYHLNPISNLGGGPVQLRLTLEGSNDNDIVYADYLTIAGCNPQVACDLLITEIASTEPADCDGNWSIEIKTNKNTNLNYSLDNGNSWTTQSKFDDIVPGQAYQIRVKDLSNDCEVNWPETIQFPNIGGAYLSGFQKTDASDCFQGSIQIDAISPNGVAGSIEYQLKNLSTLETTPWQMSNTFQGLAPATYQVYLNWLPSNNDNPSCVTTQYGSEYRATVLFDPDGCSASCTDGKRNGDEEGVDCGGSNCPPCEGSGENGCSYQTLDTNDFESGWGIWNDGGSDAQRTSDASAANSGVYSLLIRDNSSTSVVTTDAFDWSNFNKLRISFSYYPHSMDNSSEDFWLQISLDGGSSFTTIEEWNFQDEFVNDQRYAEEVIYEGNLSSNTKLRFRCDASTNGDWVTIDDVKIEGCKAPSCDDGIWNGDEMGVDCGGSNCAPCPEFCNDNFDNDGDGFIDCEDGDCPPCGANTTCTYYQRNFSRFYSSNDWIYPFWNHDNDPNISWENNSQLNGKVAALSKGSQEVELTTDRINAASVNEIRLALLLRFSSFEEGDELQLKVSNNGSSYYETVHTWRVGSGFQNDITYADTVSIQGPFSTITRLRLRIPASSDQGTVYVDDIETSTCTYIEICDNGVDDDGDAMADNDDSDCGPADFQFIVTENDCQPQAVLNSGTLDIILPAGVSKRDFTYQLEGPVIRPFQEDNLFIDLPSGPYWVYGKSTTSGAVSQLAPEPIIVPCNVEICDNGIDDDEDGLIDCEDDDCPSCIEDLQIELEIGHDQCLDKDNQAGFISVSIPSNSVGVQFKIEGPVSYGYQGNGATFFSGLSTGSYNLYIRNVINDQEVFYNNNPIKIECEDIGGLDQFVCTGGETQIGLPNDDPDLCFKWEPTDGLSNPGIPNPTAQVEEETIYKVVVTNRAGELIAEDEVTVSPFAKEVIHISPEVVVHQGRHPFLTAEDGFTNYQWELVGKSQLGRVAKQQATTTGIYRVTATDSKGCEAEGTKEVIDCQDPAEIKAYLESIGFLSIPIRIEDLPGLVDDVVELRDVDYVITDHTDGLPFVVVDGEDAVTDLEARIQAFLNGLEVCTTDRIGLISENKEFCDPSFIYNGLSAVNQHGLSVWVHLLEHGEEDQLMIRVKFPEDEGGVMRAEERAHFQYLLGLVANDQDDFDFATKTDQILSSLLNVASVPCAIVEEPFDPNAPIDNTYVAPSGANKSVLFRAPCEPSDKEQIGISPSNLPVRIEPNATLRFGVSRDFQKYVDSRALVGFTIHEGSNKGIYQGIVRRTCVEGKPDERQFIGYRNILGSGDEYIYKFQTEGLTSPIEAKVGWRDTRKTEKCPFYIVFNRELSFNPIDLNDRASGDLVNQFRGIASSNGTPVIIPLCEIKVSRKDVLNTEIVYPNPPDGGTYPHPGGWMIQATVEEGEFAGGKVFLYVAYDPQFSVEEPKYWVFNPCGGNWAEFDLPDHEYDVYLALIAAVIQTAKESGHLALDLGGLVLDPLDFVNGLWYLWEDDLENATISFAGGAVGIGMTYVAGRVYLKLSANKITPFGLVTVGGRVTSSRKIGVIMKAAGFAELTDDARRAFLDWFLERGDDGKLLRGEIVDRFLDDRKLFEGWKLMHRHRNLRKQMDVIESATRLISNSTEALESAKLNLKMIEEVLEANRLAKRGAIGVKQLLDGLDILVKSGTKLEDFPKLITDLKKGNNFTIGAGFVLRYLTGNTAEFAGKSLKFEDPVRLGESSRRIDLRAGNILYEFKSVASVPPAPSNFVMQFSKDLEIADDLTQIKWIFDKKKIPELDTKVLTDALKMMNLEPAVISKFVPNGTLDELIMLIEMEAATIFKVGL